MKLTVDRAKQRYREFNALYFGMELPEDIDIELVKDLRLDGGKRSRLWAATSKRRRRGFLIQLLAGMPHGLWELKLMHEMVHVKIWPASHRSSLWINEVGRIAAAGFLMEVL